MDRNYPRLEDETYEFIKGEATHILVMHKIRCPISGFEIATKMGISLVPYSYLSKRKHRATLRVSEDGFLLVRDGREYIFYNNIDRSYERQNWTILHEIGHIVLDHTGHSPVEETEANFFAKFIIAPPVLIHRIQAEDVMDVYLRFNVSYEAAQNTYCYYQKWLRQHRKKNDYTAYEKALLRLYEENQRKQSA